MPVDPTYSPSSSHLELGPKFYDVVRAARFPAAVLRFRNQAWAERVGLGGLTPTEWEDAFACFRPLPGNLPEPLALRYHGHQFRSYNPDLGDGRGFLFAQLRDGVDGRLLDLGTKGTGQTPWSRAGDGRLTLKGAVREALATEMLEALGVCTSKTFSIFETGEKLERRDEPSPTRSAALVRLSHGHVRFGTFQRQAAEGDAEALGALLRYSARVYFAGDLDAKADVSELAPAFLREVARRSARLAAGWMIAGFVHGVLNTDNMNVTGESFDYGPYRFLPTYDPSFVAAYFDQTGLYAYGRQPESVLWNLQQLARSLVPLVSPASSESASVQASVQSSASVERLAEALDAFGPEFNAAVAGEFLKRVGVRPRTGPENEGLFAAAFRFLDESQIGFDQFFHDVFGGPDRARARAVAGPQAKAYAGAASAWAAFDAAFASYEPTAAARDALAIGYFRRGAPCSLLIDEIEWIWSAIADSDDWSRFEGKIAGIREMRRAYGRDVHRL